MEACSRRHTHVHLTHGTACLPAVACCLPPAHHHQPQLPCLPVPAPNPPPQPFRSSFKMVTETSQTSQTISTVSGASVYMGGYGMRSGPGSLTLDPGFIANVEPLINAAAKNRYDAVSSRRWHLGSCKHACTRALAWARAGWLGRCGQVTAMGIRGLSWHLRSDMPPCGACGAPSPCFVYADYAEVHYQQLRHPLHPGRVARRSRWVPQRASQACASVPPAPPALRQRDPVSPASQLANRPGHVPPDQS
jgi:hypothetical protein